MELNKTNVTFDEVNHTYLLDGVIPVIGITGVLQRQLFPGKYDEVPEAVLEAARLKGTAVHQAVQLYDKVGLEDEACVAEIEGYKTERAAHGWVTVENEYTVTDGKDYASNIDLVLTDAEDKVVLADIKTTYELDKAYVKWQLSIYAYLFELVNPHLKVDKLVGLWLRGDKHEAVEVERIPSEECKRLLECDRQGESYMPMGVDVVKKTEGAEMAVIAPNVIDEYIRMTAEVERLQSNLDKIKAAAMEAMKAFGVKSWKGEKMSITYVAPKTSKRLDSKRLKEEKPELYEEYCTETQSRESLTIKVKS